MPFVAIYGTDYDEVPTPATKDVRVRKALSLAIDREEIVRHVLLGRGKPAIYPYSVWPFSVDIEFAALPKVEYDPAKAKQLLVEACYPNGFAIELVSSAPSGAPWIPQIVETVGSYWGRIGVKAKIVPMA